MFTEINGITMFYKKAGSGTPVILLHGNGENHSIFDRLIPKLAENHTVYAIDSRNHGQTSKVKTLSYDEMAQDVAALIQKLGIEKPMVYGFSDGGIVGLLLAIRYPKLLSRLIVSGANAYPRGLKAAYYWRLKLQNLFRRSILLQMMLTQPNITQEQLQSIRIPVALLVGDRDLIDPSHTRWIGENIPNSITQVLPNENHSSYVVHNDKLYNILSPYIE